MSKLAKDLMTADPQCCTADTTLNEVAKLMVSEVGEMVREVSREAVAN